MWEPDHHHAIPPGVLPHADRDVQHAVMEVWFRRNFTHSPKGGAAWDSPRDPREELEAEFSASVSPELIEALADELTRECSEWVSSPWRDEYDELAQDIARISGFYSHFSGAILDIERLLGTRVDPSVGPCLLRLLYVNVVTSLETYLSDAFINCVVNDQSLLRRFLETTPEFQAKKISYAEVLKAAEDVDRTVRAHLIDVVWHHIGRIKPMYEQTLGITFPDELTAKISRAVFIRHDIVHRNGRTKDGKEIEVSEQDVRELIQTVEDFVKHIDIQVADVRPKGCLE